MTKNDLYPSPSPLPETTRRRVIEALNHRLVDGLDLHSQIKVAHWNVKGPHFAALHPLFETFAIALANFNDQVAERAVTLGGLAVGTARQVASGSRLADYPPGLAQGHDHVAQLADRIEVYLEGVRQSRTLAEELDDTDSADLLTQIVTEFEKNAWFLRASLAG